jgi:hypothetical protein
LLIAYCLLLLSRKKEKGEDQGTHGDVLVVVGRSTSVCNDDP